MGRKSLLPAPTSTPPSNAHFVFLADPRQQAALTGPTPPLYSADFSAPAGDRGRRSLVQKSVGWVTYVRLSSLTTYRHASVRCSSLTETSIAPPPRLLRSTTDDHFV